MKKKLLLILTILPFVTFSQNYKRTIFEYQKLKTDTISVCDKNSLDIIDKSFIALQENNSTTAVKMAKQEYETNKSCPQIFEVYGYSLFRSGEWFDGIEIIEKGIEKFGSNPYLIKRKSEMSLEMAELGIGQKNIDGNSVYKANSLKYDEEQFKSENLKSALNDLEYLVKVYNRNEEIYYIAMIYQILKNYEKSNEIFEQLLNDENYKNAALFNISENLINLKKYDEAENQLNQLLVENPKSGQVFEKLAEIYTLKNDENKSQNFKNMSIYYNNIPSFTNLNYSTENFDLLKFFAINDNKAEKKLKKLKEIENLNNQDYTIDVCLMILKLHANHGNGVEERATEILRKIGKPSIEKVHLLFQSNVSTCTITNLSDIMATVKDEKSWELLKTYLQQIVNMPTTLIPPSVPEKMIQFNEDNGVREILAVIKNILNNKQKSDNPMDQLNSFSDYIYYSPLEKISKSKLKKIATELNYSDTEYKELLEKLK